MRCIFQNPVIARGLRLECLLLLAMAGVVPGDAAPGNVAAGDQAVSKSSSASLADLAWIQGHWILERNGDLLEEIWSAPEGNSMMGMFRWVKKGGKVWLFELMTISQEGNKVLYRFRHFGGDLKAWEEKEKPLSFQLKSVAENEAIFEGLPEQKMRRYRFQKQGENSLVVHAGRSQFQYKRKQ